MPVGIQEDIRGLQIAMNDTAAVSNRQSICDFFNQGNDLLQGQRCISQQRLQITGETRHDEKRAVRFAPVIVQRHNIGMIQPCHKLAICFKAPDKRREIGVFGQDNLDRNLPVKPRLQPTMNGTIRPHTNRLCEGITSNRAVN